MRKVHMLIGAALMMISSGFAEEIKVPVGRRPIGSDVVVESVVREIKSIPKDTVNLIGDTVKMATDEVPATARAVASVFYEDEREKAAARGEREVADAWDVSEELHFRSYKVSDEIADLLLNAAGNQDDPQTDVSAFFNDVPFGENASAYYISSRNRLLVRQTMDNILAIEYVLADYQTASRDLLGHQVEIEVKFVEVSQSTLDELGFNWTFNNKSDGDLGLIDDVFLPASTSLLSDGLRTASGVFSAADPGVLGVRKVSGSLSWDLVIKALEQAEDTDVLSAPRIVTLDGEAATIEVGEERQVPKSFAINQQNTSIYIQHTDWDLELMGVSLKVTPELRSDGLIRLELNPKVVDLLGYDNYQVTPDDAHMLVVSGVPHQWLQKQGIYPVVTETIGGVQNSVGNLYNSIVQNAGGTDVNAVGANGAWYDYHDNSRAWSKDELFPVPVLSGELPYFRVREIETSVTVADGSTVGMGGLIYDKNETFRDKVPVLGSIPLLGRLFRSEGERSIKRNLMIFVTATQVDVNGRRVVDMNLAN